MKKKYPKKYIFLWLLFFLINFPVIAQQKLLTGTINDKSGKPVVNAMVSIREHPGIKVFTDNEGKFSITGEAGQLLEVRTRENHYKSVRISTDAIVLTITDNDDLIPVGFGKELRKEEVTSAIGFVKADEMGRSSVRNPAKSLYGMIPGLTVLQNGGTDWNTDPTLFIRGIETFGQGGFVNTDILTLVDGFEQPISSLSLAEIESVAVLKDAAALAMYGMRGANGVLLVTTRRGTGKGLSVDVNYERGVTQPFRLPKFLDAYGYASAINQARANDGLTAVYSQPELDRFQSGSSPFLYPNVNWIDQSLKNHGSTDNLNISFQEQASAVRYMAVLNYANEEGLWSPVDLNSGYTTQSESRKFNFRGNMDIDITKSTLFTVRLAGNLGQDQRPGYGSNENSIISAIYSTPSAAFPIRTHNPANRTLKNWGGTTTWPNNPFAVISANGYSTRGQRQLMTDFSLEQKLDKLLQGLSAEAAISYDVSFDYIDQKTQTFQYEWLRPILDPSTYAIIDSTSTTYGTNSSLVYSTSIPTQWRRQTILGDLQYSKDWSNNEIKSVLLFQSEEKVILGQNTTYRHLLAAGNVHYGRAGKYYADITLAMNGTNVLPKADRFGFFPAISLAWKLSNEEWLRGSPVINDLKLRASWGITGNDQLIQNIFMSTWASGTGYYFGTSNNSSGGYAEGRLASSPLTFETSNKSNIGIDATLLKNVDLSLDLFYDKRKGIMVQTSGSLSGAIRVSQPYSCVGITENKGLELGINLQEGSGDIRYHIGGQFSYTISKIDNMLEAYQPYDYLKRTGKMIGQTYGLEAIGFFKDASEIAASPKQNFSVVLPGDIKYKDQNGDGIIDDFDQVPIGYSTQLPQIYYSGSIGAEYKGIGIDAVFQGIANKTTYLNTSNIFWPLVNNTNISTYSDNAWTPATSSNATLPRLTTVSNANNYQANSIWLVNGSYLKLRSVELYYDFNKSLLSHLKLKNARLYIRGMNLLSFDKIKIVDPEAIGNTYPTLSTYLIGIQIGF